MKCMWTFLTFNSLELNLLKEKNNLQNLTFDLSLNENIYSAASIWRS